MWTSVSEVLGPVVSLGLEANEHKRANHIHREGIAQNLRIHEAETNALKEYHRTEIRQQNEQHSRSLFQTKVQHEESIDLEKRFAMRENLRDEWEQMTDKAETMLIVNTLMLGLSCAFLIEGEFPQEVPLFVPMAPVFYYSLLAFATSSLLLSVRFAMVLRFRVGQTIVKEMRTAMRRNFHLDTGFRNSEHYRKCNHARVIQPACDDTNRGSVMQSYGSQLNTANAWKRGSIFQEMMNDQCTNLSWIEEETGYHQPFAKWFRIPRLGNLFGCRRRRVVDAQPIGQIFREDEDIEDENPTPRIQFPFNPRVLRTANSNSSNESTRVPNSEPERDRDTSDTPETPTPDEDGDRDFHYHAEEISRSYNNLLSNRETEDKLLQSRLESLRKNSCKPYEIHCQLCFWVGTLALFCAAVTLTYGRIMTVNISNPPVGAIASSRLAALSYTVMLIGTFALMLTMERVLSWKKKEEDKSDVSTRSKNPLPKDRIPTYFAPLIYAYLITVAGGFIIAQGVSTGDHLQVIGRLSLDDYWDTQGATISNGLLYLVSGYSQYAVQLKTLSSSVTPLSFSATDVCRRDNNSELTYLANHTILGSNQAREALKLGCGMKSWIAYGDSFERVPNILENRVDLVVKQPLDMRSYTLSSFESTSDGLYALYDDAWLVRLRDNHRLYLKPYHDSHWVAMAAEEDGLVFISEGNHPYLAKMTF